MEKSPGDVELPELLDKTTSINTDKTERATVLFLTEERLRSEIAAAKMRIADRNAKRAEKVLLQSRTVFVKSVPYSRSRFEQNIAKQMNTPKKRTALILIGIRGLKKNTMRRSRMKIVRLNPTPDAIDIL